MLNYQRVSPKKTCGRFDQHIFSRTNPPVVSDRPVIKHGNGNSSKAKVIFPLKPPLIGNVAIC